MTALPKSNPGIMDKCIAWLKSLKAALEDEGAVWKMRFRYSKYDAPYQEVLLYNEPGDTAQISAVSANNISNDSSNDALISTYDRIQISSHSSESTMHPAPDMSAPLNDNSAADTMIPATLFTSMALSTFFTASAIKRVYDEKQSDSTVGTVGRTAAHVSVPVMVGCIPAGIAAASGLELALPVTFTIAATVATVASICGGFTLGMTLYYNKFFVSKTLSHIQESVKKIPESVLSLDQKKSLIHLINHSLSIFHGDKAKGMEHTHKKIKEIDPEILFNLCKMKQIFARDAVITSKETNKEQHKYCKHLNQDIDTILGHSLLFFLLINDVKYLKDICDGLNFIKSCEKSNSHHNIQNILAQISVENLNNKRAQYNELLEQFKKEHHYLASKTAKLRHTAQSVIAFIPEKKDITQFHERVIHMASEINDDYQELKKIIRVLQEHLDELTQERSKHQLFDIYTAYKMLSYRNVIEDHVALLEQNDVESHAAFSRF